MASIRTPHANLRRLTALALWTILLLVMLLNSAGVFAIDTKPEIYWAPARAAELFSQPWQESPQLGWPNFNVGLTPVPAFLSLFEFVGIDPILSVRVFRLLLYTIAAFGVAQLVRDLRGATKLGWPELVAAVVYVANPFAVAGAATNAVLMPFALLPWLAWAFFRAHTAPPAWRWRWPAVFALTFFLMSGQNAGVIPLLMLLVLPIITWIAQRAHHTSWRNVASVWISAGALTFAVSLYWLIPSAIATAQGVSVLQNSETLEGINATSSLAEVLRGLGFWAMYGSDAQGPWQSGFGSYLTNPLVITLSFGITLALVIGVFRTRSAARLPLTVMALFTAVLMSGLFPYPGISPFARVLGWVFNELPATGAFRTLNKAGPLFVLAVAVLAGMAYSVWSMSHRRPRTLVVAGVCGAILVTGSVWPALSGGLFPRLLPIPTYWQDAGAEVSKGNPNTRVWFAPGEVQGNYTWATTQPDDLPLPLVDRSTILRTTLPITSAETSNFLAAVDTQLQRGELSGNSVSKAAQIMGVDSIVVRNDTRWQSENGARPLTIAKQMNADSYLAEPVGFGRPGENLSPTLDGEALGETNFPPVQVYPVEKTGGIVRAESLLGMNLVVGDGFSLPQLMNAGLAGENQSFRYLGDMDQYTFNTLLGPERRLVLTDSNRRRNANLAWLVENQGPLLSPDTPLQSSRTLFATPDQTTLRVEGGAVAKVTSPQNDFGTLPYISPENANDGDQLTSWQFGELDSAIGQSISIMLDEPSTLSALSFTQPDLGPVKIAKIALSFGGFSTTVEVADVGPTPISLPNVRGEELIVEILETRGDGFNRVGISELGIPNVAMARIAVLPLTLQNLSADLNEATRQTLARTPLDVLFQREGAAPGMLAEESRLLRDFTLPTERRLRPYGLLRAGPNVSDVAYDQATGRGGPVTAHASSRFFDDLAWRGSQAVDGNPDTAWVPAAPEAGASLTLTGPTQTMTELKITQDSRAWVDKLAIFADDVPLGEFDLAAGESVIPLPATTASSVKLEVISRDGDASLPVFFNEVVAGGWQIPTITPTEQPCLDVGQIDGLPFLVKPLATVPPAGSVLFEQCSDPLTLGAGAHTLRNSFDWVLDTLVLRDTSGEQVVQPGRVPNVRVTATSGPTYQVGIGPAPEPFMLVLANSSDQRWMNDNNRARSEEPFVVDGMANAWLMSPGDATTATLSFSTKPWVSAGWILSALSLLAVLLMIVLPRRVISKPRVATPDVVPVAPSKFQTKTGRIPQAWRWGAAIAVATWFLGVVGLVTSLVFALLHLRRSWTPRMLQIWCIVCVVLLPVTWVFGYPAPKPMLISALGVIDNPWPNVVAGVLIASLWVSVLRLENILRGRSAGPANPPDTDADTDKVEAASRGVHNP